MSSPANRKRALERKNCREEMVSHLGIKNLLLLII